MIRTMARVTDVHILEEDNEVMDLPKVNEDLRNFFLPRKYVAPEPEVVPEAKVAPVLEGADSTLEAVKTAPMEAAAEPEPVKALKAAAAQPPQSPTSAYRPGAFDNRGLAEPAKASASKPSKKWFSFSKSSNGRLSKESKSSRFSSFNSTATAAVPVPTRFLEKHGAETTCAAKAQEPAAEEPVAETTAEPIAEEPVAEEHKEDEAAATKAVEVPTAEEPAAEAVEETLEAPVVEEVKAAEPVETEAAAVEPVAAEEAPVAPIEAQIPEETTGEHTEKLETIEEPKEEAHIEAVLADYPVLEAPEEKAAEETFEEAVAEQPVEAEAEVSATPEHVTAADALEPDMHPIAEHPAAKAEAAAETPAEEKVATEEAAEAESAPATDAAATEEPAAELKDAVEESLPEVPIMKWYTRRSPQKKKGERKQKWWKALKSTQ